MLPVRLELRNFLAYRAPDPINFDGIDLACLSGPNGAGKSSLLDAITWVLWKRARADTKEDDKLIHMGQHEMSVIFDFRQDEIVYRVVRKLSKRGAHSTSTLDLLVWNAQSEEFCIINEPTMRETQAKINEILRLDYDTFVHSAFVQQGKADSFTLKSGTDRKKILAEILGLSLWQDYELQAKAQIQTIQNELKAIELSIAEKEREEAREPELRAEWEQAKAKSEAAVLERQAAEANYDEVAGIPAARQAAEASLNDQKRRLTDLQSSLDSIDRELFAQNKRLDSFRTIIAQQEVIEAGYEQLIEARQIDYDFGGKLDQLSLYEKQLNELHRRLDKERADLLSQANIEQERIRQAEKEISAAEKLAVELATIEQELAELDALKAERDSYQNLMVALGEEKSALKATNKTLRAEMDDIKQRRDLLQTGEALCPVCNQPLDDYHREELIARYNEDGTVRGDSFRNNDNRIKEIDEESLNIEASLRGIDTSIRRYDTLKSREGALQQQVTQAEQAASRIEAANVALASIAQIMDNEQFGEPIRVEIAQVETDIDALGYDKEIHSEARKAMRDLQQYDDQKRDLDLALGSYADVEANINGIHERRERTLAQLAEEKSQLAEKEADLEALAEAEHEFQRRKMLMNQARMAEREAISYQQNIEQKLKAITDARSRKSDLQDRREQLREEETLYTELKEAFGIKGIPAMVIEAAIPEIEATANKLLRRMTDGRMNIRLDTQKTNKSGGAVETLEILISDELGTRSYDMFSGGEGFRVNFALRIALSQCLARRAGARLQTLVIDEGFGSQDAAGRERLVEAINAIKEDFKLILIVTHIDELRDQFPVHIEIRKTANGSVVSLK